MTQGWLYTKKKYNDKNLKKHLLDFSVYFLRWIEVEPTWDDVFLSSNFYLLTVNKFNNYCALAFWKDENIYSQYKQPKL